MTEESFSYKTLRNALYLFLGFLLPMVFTIFVIREMATRLGTEEFGVYLLVNAVGAFVGYVDLGLTTAVTKYVAEYYGRKDFENLRNILSSSKVLFAITGTFGLLAFSAVGFWLLPAFGISEPSTKHIFVVFVFAGLVFLFNSLNSTHTAILTALQRFDLITKMNLVNLVIVSLGTIALLKFDFRLKAIMALQAFVSLAYLLATIFFARRLMPNLRLGFFIIRSEIKKAYQFGFLTFISNLAGSCLIYLDRLIIPIFLGPTMLAFYSVPGNVAIKTTNVTNSLGGMFFPMASAFEGAGEMDRLKAVYIRAFRNLSAVAAAVTVAIILFADKILYFWLGPEYAAKGSEILVILALTNYVVSLYIPLQSILLGLGRLKFLIRQSLVMAGLNLILLLIFVPRFGILGAAWAYLISVLPMAYAFYWTERNIFGLARRQASHYIWLYAKLLFTAVISGLIIIYFLAPWAQNIMRLVIVGPASVLLYLFLYYIFRFTDKEDEAIVFGFLKNFLRF